MSRESMLRQIISVLYWLPVIRHNIVCRRNLLLPMYRRKAGQGTSKSEEPVKKIIYMVQPETTFSGGLSDRLRAVVAIYKECKRQGLPFKIVFEPLHLEDYLIPNEYDWRIRPDEISYDTCKVYPCTLLTYHRNTKDRYQHFVQRTILRFFLSKEYGQVHIYSNMICKDEDYGRLFKELFRPSEELERQVAYHLEKIGGADTYISVTFRFRQLLGDFKEGGDILPVCEREAYINKCMDSIRRLHGLHPGQIVLVTSDSSTFLEKVSEDRELSLYTYIIPGKVVHVGFTFDANRQTYMKSFVDYFMLSHAHVIYLARDKKMYHSGFPYRAALLNNKRYNEIKI